MNKTKSTNRVPRVRILIGAATALGPGKVELLKAIRDKGSISAAAREMSMSYRRAWLLVDTMNHCFKKDLVTTATGGRGGGGARITEFGKDVIQRYQEIETQAAASVKKQASDFSKLLKNPQKDV